MTSCENTVEQVLQRRGSITLYRQVADDISAKFRRLYQPGDQLPSEMDLTKEYGVSRTTVRRALEYLENRELIVRKQGKGIFVNISRIHQDLLQLDGFYPSLLKHGVDPLTRLQRFEIVEATPKVQAALRTGDDRVLLLERYYQVANRPLALNYSYFSAMAKVLTRVAAERHPTNTLLTHCWARHRSSGAFHTRPPTRRL